MESETGDTQTLYVVLSHTRPNQVIRLVRTLRELNPSCFVVVHHDYARTDLDPGELVELSRVHLIEAPERVEWGDFSIVAAILRVLEWACGAVAFDWAVVISGQDYPTSHPRMNDQRLRAGGVDGFVDAHAVVAPPTGWTHADASGGGLGRRYYFRYWRLPAAWLRAPALARRAARRVGLMLSDRQPLLAVHPMPANVPWRVGLRRFRTPFSDRRPCRTGWAWFSLSRRAVDEVFKTIREEPGLLRHYRRTILPDESFFQTILFGNPDLTIMNEDLRYTRWVGESNPHPQILTSDDAPEILDSGAHFGRKFDEEIDGEVLDMLDHHLAAPQAPLG